ncbi:MAG: hypothetical protein H6667_20760 [Ardenticatenaceae bacterium]|nr:hypothetical protein [Ardenticatenaceae bacterium]
MTHNLEAIRQLINEAFDAEEVSQLAYDRFYAVYSEFTAATSKSRMIDAVITYAKKNGRIPDLLDYIQENSPYYYREYADKI